MASITATTLAYIAVGASVVGGGIAAYSSYAQGRLQNSISSFNATQREKEARMQAMAMQTQANLQKQGAEAQFAMRQQEAAARFNNAISIGNQVSGQDAIDRVNLTKRREEGERAMASARAAIAASGAVETTGTPLDILAETAATIQKDQEEQFYERGLARSAMLREAEMERLGGSLAIAGATLDRNSDVAASALNGAAGRAQYQSGLREAQLMRLSGRAAQSAGNLQAGATLFSTLGGAAQTGYTYRTS